MRLVNGIFAFVLLIALGLTPSLADPYLAAPHLGEFLAALLIYHLVWKINTLKSIKGDDRLGYTVTLCVFGSLISFLVGTHLQLALQALSAHVLSVAIYTVAALNVGYCIYQIKGSLPPSMAVSLLSKKNSTQTEIAEITTDPG